MNDGRDFKAFEIQSTPLFFLFTWTFQINLSFNSKQDKFSTGWFKKKTRVREAAISKPLDQSLIPLAYIKNNTLKFNVLNFR